MYMCICVRMSVTSHAAWWSLLLVGAAVATPLVLLELFPLGRVGRCSSGWRAASLPLGLGYWSALGFWADGARSGALAVCAYGTLWDLTSLRPGRFG